MRSKQTIAEIAIILGIDKEDARGLVRGLVALDILVFRGVRPSPSGRGKGENVYDMHPLFSARFRALGKKIEEG